jgi:rhodanese-related sulfurtransferase
MWQVTRLMAQSSGGEAVLSLSPAAGGMRHHPWGHLTLVTDTPARSNIDRLLDRAREGLDRVPPDRLSAEMAAGALVVDTRPVHQRRCDGELPGAVVVDRNVLEWRLDPTSPDRLPGLELAPDSRVILVCNEGYSSSLAAATLRELGLHRATDLAGGYQAWLARRSGPPQSPKEALLRGSPRADSSQGLREAAR